MTTPEINQEIIPQSDQQVEPVVAVVPKEVDIPPELERATGVQPRQTQVTATVTDNSGKPMMSSPATSSITVTLPASTDQLTIWSKGSPSEALTWLASFWLRLVKKAMHFGWNIIGGGEVKPI